MIRSHIGFIKGCEVVLKLVRFFNLSGRSFGLGYLSLILSLRAMRESYPKCEPTSGFSRGGQ